MTPDASPPPAIAVRGATKRFGATVAVAGVNLDVARGSFFGIVGPNGAGKTTLLGIATGLLRPDGGQVFVEGIDVWADPVRAKAQLGVLPEGLRLFERLTGEELLTYAGLLRSMPRDVIDMRARELLDVLELSSAARTLVTDYSTGMKKKIGLAVAMIHAPSVLVLDEPFEAVDPVSARVIRGVLASYTAVGGTVVMSSHVMDLVERTCDEVAVMAAGAVRAVGRVADLPAGQTLEDVFIGLVGGDRQTKGLAWLAPSRD